MYKISTRGQYALLIMTELAEIQTGQHRECPPRPQSKASSHFSPDPRSRRNPETERSRIVPSRSGPRKPRWIRPASPPARTGRTSSAKAQGKQQSLFSSSSSPSDRARIMPSAYLLPPRCLYFRHFPLVSCRQMKMDAAHFTMEMLFFTCAVPIPPLPIVFPGRS